MRYVNRLFTYFLTYYWSWVLSDGHVALRGLSVTAGLLVRRWQDAHDIALRSYVLKLYTQPCSKTASQLLLDVLETLVEKNLESPRYVYVTVDCHLPSRGVFADQSNWIYTAPYVTLLQANRKCWNLPHGDWRAVKSEVPLQCQKTSKRFCDLWLHQSCVLYSVKVIWSWPWMTCLPTPK